jgi:hypothetical protein
VDWRLEKLSNVEVKINLRNRSIQQVHIYIQVYFSVIFTKKNQKKPPKAEVPKKSRDLLPVPCMPPAPFIGLLYLLEAKLIFIIKRLQLIKIGLHKSLLSDFEMKSHCL